MDKQVIIKQLEISDRTWRRWCSGLNIPSNSPNYSDEEISKLLQLKEMLANKVKFDDALAQITGKRPEPKQAPGRYNNLPSELQPKTVAAALVQQFDKEVMNEFFNLLHQPLSRQEVSNFMGQLLPEDTVLDAYLLEAGD